MSRKANDLKIKYKNLLSTFVWISMLFILTSLHLPNVIITLDGKKEADLNKKTLAVIKKVTASFEMKPETPCIVVEYRYIYRPLNGFTIVGISKDENIPAQLKICFQKATIGDLLIISDVKIKEERASPKAVNGRLVVEVH